MKRSIYLVFSMVFLSTLPFYGQKLRVGINTGLNVSTLSEPGNIYDNEALKTGFGGGLALKYSISESFGMQSGIIYEQKGFREKRDFSNNVGEYSGTYNYITVPLVAEGSMILLGNTRLYGQTGLYAGFKTHAENAVDLTVNEIMPVVTNSEINETDYGWIFGGGVQVPAGSHLIQLGFRYSLGLYEVSDAASKDRNKSILFGATIFF